MAGGGRVSGHGCCPDCYLPFWCLWLKLEAGRTHALGLEPCLAGLPLLGPRRPHLLYIWPLPRLPTAGPGCRCSAPFPNNVSHPNMLSPILAMVGWGP